MNIFSPPVSMTTSFHIDEMFRHWNRQNWFRLICWNYLEERYWVPTPTMTEMPVAVEEPASQRRIVWLTVIKCIKCICGASYTDGITEIRSSAVSQPPQIDTQPPRFVSSMFRQNVSLCDARGEWTERHVLSKTNLIRTKCRFINTFIKHRFSYINKSISVSNPREHVDMVVQSFT